MNERFQKRNRQYALMNELLADELKKMQDEGVMLSVRRLSERCFVSRNTIYNHPEIILMIREHRTAQQNKSPPKCGERIYMYDI